MNKRDDFDPPGGTPAPRVVVADDSAFMRRLIADALARHGADVVALARNGREALDACTRHQPDVLSLDLAMPELDGLAVLRALGSAGTTRVVVVSAFSERDGSRAVDALAEGAFDLVPKLSGRGKLNEFTEELVAKIFAAAQAVPIKPAVLRVVPTHRPPAPAPATATAPGKAQRAVVIASSTGGPRALSAVVPKLPATTGRGVLIVQHMPPGFTQSLAARLDALSALTVREAEDDAELTPTAALVAPGGRHMRLRRSRVKLGDEAPVGGLRPCADLTIASAVDAFAGDVVLAVLTGMGRDALEGARRVHAAGGVVLAEDPSTCTVFGMPKAVIDAGLADAVVAIDELAASIARYADG